MVIILKNTKRDFEDVNPRDIFDFACELDEITRISAKSAVNPTNR